MTVALAWVLMGAAWLAPNHYPPWTSFHADLMCAVGFSLLLVTALVQSGRTFQWPRLALAAFAVATVPLVQAAFGQIFFWGDAWMATLYLMGFGLAIGAGYNLVRNSDPAANLRLMWLTIALAAIVSVGIALYQWFSLTGLEVFAVDLPPAGRPFANLAQPNHLATLILLGLVGACALRQSGDIGGWTLALTVAYLGFGVVMTQSRTAWIATSGVLLWFCVSRVRADTRVTRQEMAIAAAGFVVLTTGWETLCQWLDLPVGRTLAEQAGDGARRLLWAATARAILDAPIWGYGWNQVSVAQSRLALDNPPSGVMFEHSHSIVLDLLAWNGVPLGLAIVTGLLAWTWSRLRACRNAEAAYLLAAIIAVGAHALAEFPLDYAYFLLPLGLWMGAAQALCHTEASRTLGRTVPRALSLLVGALAVCVTLDYFKLEENYRQLRFEASRTGVFVVNPDVPDVLVLTQLREFVRFARAPATRGMTEPQLASMQRVAERFGYPSVLIRYALANAINRHPERAAETLIRLCRIHEVARCDEGRDAWQSASESEYTELQRIPYPKAAAP
jgi:O-antigen ligase